MKKKIAVFAGGWSFEYVQEVINGITDIAKNENADVFAFINYSLRWDPPMQCESEFNLFTLPDLRDFDGIILLGNSFNLEMETEYFREKLKEIDVPVVSVEYELEGALSIFTDNYAGMRDLAEHVIEVHGVREILFIGGPEEHMENAERLRALSDVAKKNGFCIPKANIKYGDWGMGAAVQYVNEWLEENGKLPDAIVCANDIMALGVCNRLIECGYHIPNDVIVTGYDCLTQAKEFHPILSSVSHEWGSMGRKALQMLMEKIRGEEVGNVILSTRFIANESCGCEDEESKRQQAILTARSMMDGVVQDAHFRSIYLYIRKVDNAEDLSRSLSDLFEREHQIEGEDFMLCLDPEFFRIEEGNKNLCARGYSEQIAIVGAIRDGARQSYKVIDRKDAIFYISKHRETPGFYMYVPVYNDDQNYGFAVITGKDEIIKNNQLYIWTRHMNQYLEQVRRNITITALTERLTELSVTDALTGIYNRSGCERVAYPMLSEWKARGGTGIIILVDIDKMKTINDQYGHANGDLALRTVASVLMSEVPKDWIISRFGGDEFLIGGRIVDDDVKIDTIRDAIERRLAREVMKRNITFRLTVSVGGVLIHPEDDIDIERYLQMADDDMYHVKNAHHEEINNEK